MPSRAAIAAIALLAVSSGSTVAAVDPPVEAALAPPSLSAWVEPYAGINPTTCREVLAQSMQEQGNVHWWKPGVMDALESNLFRTEESARAFLDTNRQIIFVAPNSEVRSRLIEDGLMALDAAESNSLCR